MDDGRPIEAESHFVTLGREHPGAEQRRLQNTHLTVTEWDWDWARWIDGFTYWGKTMDERMRGQ